MSLGVHGQQVGQDGYEEVGQQVDHSNGEEDEVGNCQGFLGLRQTCFLGERKTIGGLKNGLLARKVEIDFYIKRK